MLTTSSQKNFSLIASRKEKNTRNTVKITFSFGNYNIFTFLSCCLPETRTKDQIRGPNEKYDILKLHSPNLVAYSPFFYGSLVYVHSVPDSSYTGTKTPSGVLGISSDGDDRMEPKVKTQKNP